MKQMFFSGIAVIITILIFTGCSSSSTRSLLSSNSSEGGAGSILPKTKVVTDICSNLLNAYSSSSIDPKLVVFSNNKYIKSYPIHKVNDALNLYFTMKHTNEPLLLYIHGRALGGKDIGEYDNEPKESQNDVIPEFSKVYNIKTVLMLHWPHKKADKKGFPESDAQFSGKALACVVEWLNSNKYSANQFPGFRALISHSMGSLVLEEAIRKTSMDLQSFDVVSIFAAASPAKDSKDWLSKIKADKKFVLINTSDKVLRIQKERVNFEPLGMCNEACFEHNKPSNNFTYIDITKIAGLFKLRHNYFVKGKVAKRIVKKILAGQEPPKGIRRNNDNIRVIR